MSCPLLPTPEDVTQLHQLQVELARHACTVEAHFSPLELSPREPFIKAPCFVLKMGGVEVRRTYSLMGVEMFAQSLKREGWRSPWVGSRRATP